MPEILNKDYKVGNIFFYFKYLLFFYNNFDFFFNSYCPLGSGFEVFFNCNFNLIVLCLCWEEIFIFTRSKEVILCQLIFDLFFMILFGR
jgi:hypothetical protein